MRVVKARSIGLAAMCLWSMGSALDIPADTPVKQLVDSANAYLAKGSFQDALQYFDAAISKEPSNYLTIFKRGATYLSIGRTAQAESDFNAVLAIKPDFDAALQQRARINMRQGNWEAARRDFAASAAKDKEEELAKLTESEKDVMLAVEAEAKGDLEACTIHASSAINNAPQLLSLREIRAKCRLALGQIPEAIGDLTHITQLRPAATDPHVTIANLLYYSLNDFDRSVAQLRKCLHYDPESKPCKKAFRRIKSLNKDLLKARAQKEKKQYVAASKLLNGSGEDVGLITEAKEDIAALTASHILNSNCPQDYLSTLKELLCEVYLDSSNTKKGNPACEEALALNPDSIPALLSKSNLLISQELFEDAIKTLEHAKEVSGGANRVVEALNKANTLLKRSKQKDYYKIIGVSREADSKEIKKAYRSLTKQWHPDKAIRSGLTKEQAEKKMAGINEAYEVLSNEELRSRFDRGDDPNSQEQQAHPFQQGGHPFGHGGQPFHFQQGGGFPGGSQFKFHFGG